MKEIENVEVKMEIEGRRDDFEVEERELSDVGIGERMKNYK